jgi:hypothetical protein
VSGLDPFDDVSSIDIREYVPGTGLDAELAALAYGAVHGWPDQ